MRAIVCETFESPEQLVVTDVDKPEPGPKEVLIKIHATGLGFVDALTVAGLYQLKPKLPFIPGNEIAGVVEATGEAVKHYRKGQRVLAMPTSGGLSEFLCIDESKCIPLPESLPFSSAASFLVNYCTAHHGLIHCGQIKAKECILILGASGGVGAAAIDLAKAMGATVIAAASTPEKRQSCLDLGADEVVDYSSPDWRQSLKEKLNGKPLDLVYDLVGGDFSEPALRSLGPAGRFLVVGFASGQIAKIPLNLPLLKRCSVIGVNWGGHIAENPSRSRPVLTELIGWISTGKLKPQPGETYPLEETGKAMMRMLNREAIGKVVIAIQD